jgi:divalent metal cation (Fe/Co/Zn/Cd) transporter
MQAADARATKAIAVSFVALASYVAYDALGVLIDGTKPEASTVGVVLAAVSLVLMPALATAKARLAPVLGSTAAKADAAQTNLCALLSAVVLVGVGANRAVGWWWADAIAGLGIAVIAGAEAVRTWRADSLDDTCCA